MRKRCPKFGEIFFAALQQQGSVQGGQRPVVIVQNNTGNLYSPTVEILPLTTQNKATYMPTHVSIKASYENGLRADSVVLAEQTQTINQSQLKQRLGKLAHCDLVAIGRARQIQSPFPSL